MSSTIDFCRQLASESDAIARKLAAHVHDYDEILPHVFMAEIARYVLSESADRTKLVATLEAAFDGQGSEIQNLIAVSFIELISTKHELEHVLDGVLSPRLHAEWINQNQN